MDIRTVFAHPQVLLVFVALATMVATQFSSTILLLDFSDQSVVFGVRNISLAYGFNLTGSSPITGGGTGNTPWRAQPQNFPRLAEYSEDASSGDDFQDTGETFRALLPLRSAENRRALRSYFGPANVLYSRVPCVQPTVQLRSTTVIRIVGDSRSLSEHSLLRSPESHYILGNARVARNHSMVIPLQNTALAKDPLSAEGVDFNSLLKIPVPYSR